MPSPNGTMTDRTVRAIKQFQASINSSPTGELNESERNNLIIQGNRKKSAVGFVSHYDAKTGITLGLPKNSCQAPSRKTEERTGYRTTTKSTSIRCCSLMGARSTTFMKGSRVIKTGSSPTISSSRILSFFLGETPMEKTSMCGLSKAKVRSKGFR